MNPINNENIQNLSPELQRIYVASVNADRKPIQAAEERKSFITERINLLNDVLGKVEDVRKLIPNMSTPIAIRNLTVASTDEHVITGTADKNVADIGKHALEVLQLAKSSTAISNAFPDKNDTKIGSGYFTFYGPGGETKEVFIDNDNGTLEGIANIINTSNVGMKAMVITDQTNPDTPYRLLLNAEGAGAGTTVEYPEFYFVDGDEDFFIEKEKPATNAMVRYDGFDIESSTNEIKDLIKGVTVNIKGVTELGRPVNLSVEQDLPQTSLKMKEMIDGVNKVLQFIQDQNHMDDKTPSHKTLGGDYGIKMAEQKIRSAMQDNFFGIGEGGKTKILSQIGIQFNKRGTLEFDQKKFEAALAENFDEVTKVLTGNGRDFGLMPKLSAALGSIATPGLGVLANQKSTYTQRVARMDEDIKLKEKTAEKRAEMLRDKLAKTQVAFTKMKSQQGMLGSGDSAMAALKSAVS